MSTFRLDILLIFGGIDTVDRIVLQFKKLNSNLVAAPQIDECTSNSRGMQTSIVECKLW
jgi:hypothetical protein